jgi:hypothetical protein
LSNVGMPQKQKKAKIRASKQQVAKHEWGEGTQEILTGKKFR